MKGKYKLIIIFIFGIILSIAIGCVSTSSNNTESLGSFFTGTGGEGMRLGIIVPQSQGLTENQAYLPSMIQGVLVANISKYSAISVLDRVSLDRVIRETLDPTYEDNLDIVSLGHVAQVGYMMTGDITRTSTGYSLRINVTDTTPNANTIASHSGSYTIAQFDNHSAIQLASLDLLTQMGVELTASARNELGRASPQQEINGQTAMAQGIIDERNGKTVEAVLHYFDASLLETTATEALNRMAIATKIIATGSLGNQIRNDIQQRNEWIKLIEETKKFYANNHYYNLAELSFNSQLDLSKIDYREETALLTFPVQVSLNRERIDTLNTIYRDLVNGLEATGRRKQWGISFSRDPFLYLYVFDFDLLDENGKVISSYTPDAILFYSQYPLYSLYSQVSAWRSMGNSSISLPMLTGTGGSSLTGYRFSSDRSKIGTIIGIRGPYYFGTRGAKTNDVVGSSFSAIYDAWWGAGFSVKASQITDSLTIRLRNITVYQTFERVDSNGYRILTGRAERINQGTNIIPVRIGTF